VSVPAAYLTSAALRSARVWKWIEIKGLPYAFGDFSATSSIFSGRAASEQFAGVLPFVLEPPKGFDQRVDPLKSTASIGTLSFDLVDRDGDLVDQLGLGVAREDNKLTLTADGVADIFCAETPDATAYPTGGGTLYIEGETITYTSRTGTHFSGCSRSMYGSTFALHPDDSVITPYPRFLIPRDATVYYLIDDDAPTSATLADAAIRMQGIIASCKLSKDGTGFALSIDGVDRKVSGWLGVDRKKLLFGKLGKGTLKLGLPGVDQAGVAYVPDDDWTDYGRDERLIHTKPTAGFAGEGSLAAFNADRGLTSIFFIRIDDEIILANIGDGSTFLVEQRGCFGTESVPHETDADVIEVAPIAVDASGASDLAPEYEALPWTSDNPIDVALAMILSTGDGTNGDYDILPAAWAMGVPERYVDVTEIESTRDRNIDGVRVAGVLSDEVDLRSFLTDEILTVFGLFPLTKLGGTYSFRKIAPRMPLDVVTSIGPDDIVDVPDWDSNGTSVIGRVVYTYDKGLGDPLGKTVNEHTEAESTFASVFGEVTINSSLLRGDAYKARACASSLTRTAERRPGPRMRMAGGPSGSRAHRRS
jgi:hypothetical protein